MVIILILTGEILTTIIMAILVTVFHLGTDLSDILPASFIVLIRTMTTFTIPIIEVIRDGAIHHIIIIATMDYLITLYTTIHIM